MNNLIKYTLATLGVVFLLVASGWAGYYYGKDRKNNANLALEPSTTVTSSPTPTPVTSVRVIKKSTTPVARTTQATEAATPVTDEESIKSALATKLDVEEDKLNIVINKMDDTAAFGSAGVEGEMGGGFFVAAKDDSGQWIIVADGNGIIECSALEGYDISSDIVPECYDYELGDTINR